MNRPRTFKELLEILLVIAAIILIPLFFAIRSQAGQMADVITPIPEVTNIPGGTSVAPVAPIFPPVAQPTAAPAVALGKQPPTCTFPLAQIKTAASTPQNYTFSDPQVVLTDKLQPDIVDWLPDNQNVLIMPLKLIDLGINGYQQTIELFNPETKETQIYAIRRKGAEAPPIWNPKLNAVVYAATNVLGEDSATNQLKFTRQIRISYGNPNDTQILADNLPQYYMAVKPDGSQTVYLQEKQFVKLDASLRPLPSVAFNQKAQDYKHENTGNATVDYQMAWRPSSSQIFLYNWAYDNLGYTYIMETDTGRLCNLDFGGWALVTRWSPNGRYLAIIRAQGRVPLQSSDLAVLDTATGNLYTLGVPQEIGGRHILKDIAWAPDNRHLFFIGSSNDYSGTLFLGDFISGQVDHILPSYKFMAINVGTNLAWSPDGSKLLMNCPISEEVSQVCLISVQTRGQ